MRALPSVLFLVAVSTSVPSLATISPATPPASVPANAAVAPESTEAILWDGTALSAIKAKLPASCADPIGCVYDLEPLNLQFAVTPTRAVKMSEHAQLRMFLYASGVTGVDMKVTLDPANVSIYQGTLFLSDIDGDGEPESIYIWDGEGWACYVKSASPICNMMLSEQNVASARNLYHIVINTEKARAK